jgi:hypothetical protein
MKREIQWNVLNYLYNTDNYNVRNKNTETRFLIVFGIRFCGLCLTRNFGWRDLACLLLKHSKVKERGAVAILR